MRLRLAAVGACCALIFWLVGCGTTLPDVKGLTEEQAGLALKSAGFEIGSVVYNADAPGAPGAVIGQSPAAGERLRAGEAVDLVLAGKPPVRVPNLSGLLSGEASAALAAVGLVNANEQSYSPTVPAGYVIAQTPRMGVEVPSGSLVRLVTSRGPAPRAIPDVVGMPQSEAESNLKKAGFKSRTVSSHSSKAKGTVLSQSPRGKSMPPGTAIKLTISSGPAPKPARSEPPQARNHTGRFDVYEVVFGVGRTGRAFVYVDDSRILADCPYMDLSEGDSVHVTRRTDGTWVVSDR